MKLEFEFLNLHAEPLDETDMLPGRLCRETWSTLVFRALFRLSSKDMGSVLWAVIHGY
jgi:hypothetical protein